MSVYPQIRDFGDTGFGVAFGDGVDRAVNARVMALHAAIGDAGLAGVIETIPSFGTLFVQYDPLQTSRADLEGAVRAMLPGLQATAHQGRLWRIPVCYDADLAPDLADVAERCKMKPDQVIARHAAGTFFIYMLGFMPGLAYMGGLDETLQLPRRSSPRVKVPQGSVAIAETMTTIYPWESPGGWHLIGRTPIRLFDAARAAPILYGAGDEVRFQPVSRQDYDTLAARVSAGSFDHAALELAR
ncbi:5-oxoprolinase subunit PxpB [Ferrovibrio sp.]|uniref:5-oxoprolinase subunit PxpB n=1 Tax=Ferrovibrio sp. TaxID=1917215 RepID=UPI0025BD2492|nr:5-oxoprolinase subunit PxpB [Ferrovibrio sp.]MBX3455439.1 5-oxoprolinase subunit PxpB [Ferrovibrio sp.]